MPTAFTPSKGTVVFRDFELLFLTLGFSPTDWTSITVGAMFPVTSEFNLLTAGFKQQLIRGPENKSALAITGNITFPTGSSNSDNFYYVNTNLIGSIRPAPEAGFHFALGYAGVSAKDEVYNSANNTYTTERKFEGVKSYGLGGDFVLTPNVKFIAEIIGGGLLDKMDNLSILTVGFRLHGKKISADIAGIRPLNKDSGDLIFWPLVTIGYHF